MSAWYGLRGPIKIRAGTSGTETFVSGAHILQWHAFPGGGGGTVTVPCKDSPTDPAVITLPAGSGWHGVQHNHALHVLQGTGTALQMVFTGTSAYYIEYSDGIQ